MKNIYESDGLSRERRAEAIATELPLGMLEDNLPGLLTRILNRSPRFARYYRYQPIVILSEIEALNLDKIQEVFYFSEDDVYIFYIEGLLRKMEDWRQRLEKYALYYDTSVLLRDLNGQIETNLAPWFSSFVGLYADIFGPGEMGRIWYSSNSYTEKNVVAEGFLQRFFYAFRASIMVMHGKMHIYKEEIYAGGTMDPSLAVLISFLKNYGEVASRFNKRWQQLPMFYYNEILKIQPRPEKKGKTWLTFNKKNNQADLIIPAGSCFPIPDDTQEGYYTLLNDLTLTNSKVGKLLHISAKKSKARYPEAALGYVMSLEQKSFPENESNPLPIGMQMLSNIFLLTEGERKIRIICHFTDESLSFVNEVIHRVATEQNISKEETRVKVVADAFLLEVSTTDGWQRVCNLITHFRPGVGLEFNTTLDELFPAVMASGDESKPGVRLLINPDAWFFPYSWATKVYIKQVHIRVSVSGMRRILLYNDLGLIDNNQPFSPFGVTARRGSWFVFGNHELTYKRVGRVRFSFRWHHLPDNPGGMDYYYKEYKQGITNRSFMVNAGYLLNNVWKPVAETNLYLFRTADTDGDIPRTDGKLSDESSISFTLPEIDDFGCLPVEAFNFGNTRSGFFRITLSNPEMGFGDKEYRRLFTENMIFNSRNRIRKRLIPREPVQPLMDAPVMSYWAEERCFFAIGQPDSVEFSYIRPISHRVEVPANMLQPIPLIEGPQDEINLMIGVSAMAGKNNLNLYIETESLQHEIISDMLPEISWYYKDVLQWKKIHPSMILADNTGNLRYSGTVELQFPVIISQEMLDPDGFFQICLAVACNSEHCAKIKNVYTNVVQAEITSEKTETVVFPGLDGYRQISPVSDVFPAESERELNIRLRERISHRNRAIVPCDYEQLILQEFPRIHKVKCLPATDVSEVYRPATVTVVAVNERLGVEWPLCEDKQLVEIKCFIQSKISPFVNINVINPKYEEITVFCGISIETGFNAGSLIAVIREKIRKCIAPWVDKGGLPVFGYSFSVNDLKSIIADNSEVGRLHGIKLIHQKVNREGEEFTNEYTPREDDSYYILPSEPWSVLVPANSQYIVICTPDEWRNTIEYGDLELEQTFVIA